MPKEKLEELAFASYWDKRYEEEKAKIAAAGEASGAGADAEASTEPIPSFEWFRTFEKLRPFLDKYLPSAGAAEGKGDVHILHLGCGNSVSRGFLYFLV